MPTQKMMEYNNTSVRFKSKNNKLYTNTEIDPDTKVLKNVKNT